MREPSTFVGLDAHKDSMVVAMLLPGSVRPVEWELVNEPGAVRRLARKLEREAPGGVRCCYEAGPGGYVLQRQLVAAGIPCAVGAPSLIPVKPGQSIKTDRRDARKLAELFRAGLLTEVHPPGEDEEAVRDLCCAAAAFTASAAGRPGRRSTGADCTRSPSSSPQTRSSARTTCWRSSRWKRGSKRLMSSSGG